jgi:hypothetical protein
LKMYLRPASNFFLYRASPAQCIDGWFIVNELTRLRVKSNYVYFISHPPCPRRPTLVFLLMRNPCHSKYSDIRDSRCVICNPFELSGVRSFVKTCLLRNRPVNPCVAVQRGHSTQKQHYHSGHVMTNADDSDPLTLSREDLYDPGGQVKVLHLWPGQTPPGDAIGRVMFTRTPRAWQPDRLLL